jgi:hypothetical protein
VVSEVDKATRQNVANAEMLASNAGAFEIDAGDTGGSNDDERPVNAAVPEALRSSERATFQGR